MTDEAITVDTVRIALVLYAAASFSRLLGGERWERTSRGLWSAGLLFYLIHVVAAFTFVHGWSHSKAALETARRTEELFGIASGAGLFFNYLFTLVWTVDALWWWMDESGYRHRARWVDVSVQGFLAFMFFNGAVVFARGFSRWFGLAATPMLLFLWLRSRPGPPRARC
jgi:hypothetical protein